MLRDGWLEVRPVRSPFLIRLLSVRLHRGESEAIALAVEINASCTLLDEHVARAAAVQMSLNITGVLGVLLRAKKQGDIARLGDEMERRRKDAHFFIAPDLERRMLEMAGK